MDKERILEEGDNLRSLFSHLNTNQIIHLLEKIHVEVRPHSERPTFPMLPKLTILLLSFSLSLPAGAAYLRRLDGFVTAASAIAALAVAAQEKGSGAARHTAVDGAPLTSEQRQRGGKRRRKGGRAALAAGRVAAQLQDLPVDTRSSINSIFQL
jgi:hypothetical protein